MEEENNKANDYNKDAQFWKQMFLLAFAYITRPSNLAEIGLPKPPMHNPYMMTDKQKPAQWIYLD